ncbi:hypothetical protein AYI69_g4014, partial [Smittium culicis]
MSPIDSEKKIYSIGNSDDNFGFNESKTYTIKRIKTETGKPGVIENEVSTETISKKPCKNVDNSDTNIFNGDCNEEIEHVLIPEPTNSISVETIISPTETTVIEVTTETISKKPCKNVDNSETNIFNDDCNGVVEKVLIPESKTCKSVEANSAPTDTTVIEVSSETISKKPCKNVDNSDTDIFNNDCNDEIDHVLIPESKTCKSVETIISPTDTTVIEVTTETISKKPCKNVDNSDTDIFNDDCNEEIEYVVIPEPTNTISVETIISPTDTTVIEVTTETISKKPCKNV